MPDLPTLTPMSSVMLRRLCSETEPVCEGCGQAIRSTADAVYTDPRVRPFRVWEARCVTSALRALYRGPAGEQLYYDAAELGGFDPAPLAVLRDSPIQQTASERLLLYALIYGLRPARYLEIGTRLGGSALVVAAAMDAAQYDGRIVCVDPNPDIAPEHWARLEPRATLVRGWSPAAVPVAARAAGGPFDVALIDGHHTTAAVYADARELFPYMRPGGLMLFHDAYTDEVRSALRRLRWRHPWRLIDLGYLTKEITVDHVHANGPKRYCGLRALQTRRRGG
jgi:predicted O-methyltransferase YrrM